MENVKILLLLTVVFMNAAHVETSPHPECENQLNNQFLYKCTGTQIDPCIEGRHLRVPESDCSLLDVNLAELCVTCGDGTFLSTLNSCDFCIPHTTCGPNEIESQDSRPSAREDRKCIAQPPQTVTPTQCPPCPGTVSSFECPACPDCSTEAGTVVTTLQTDNQDTTPATPPPTKYLPQSDDGTSGCETKAIIFVVLFIIFFVISVISILFNCILWCKRKRLQDQEHKNMANGCIVLPPRSGTPENNATHQDERIDIVNDSGQGNHSVSGNMKETCMSNNDDSLQQSGADGNSHNDVNSGGGSQEDPSLSHEEECLVDHTNEGADNTPTIEAGGDAPCRNGLRKNYNEMGDSSSVQPLLGNDSINSSQLVTMPNSPQQINIQPLRNPGLQGESIPSSSSQQSIPKTGTFGKSLSAYDRADGRCSRVTCCSEAHLDYVKDEIDVRKRTDFFAKLGVTIKQMRDSEIDHKDEGIRETIRYVLIDQFLGRCDDTSINRLIFALEESGNKDVSKSFKAKFYVS